LPYSPPKKNHSGRPGSLTAGADKGEPVELTSFEELDKKIRIVISDYALLKKQYGELEEQLKKKIAGFGGSTEPYQGAHGREGLHSHEGGYAS